MIALVRAELRKLAARRLTWGLLLIAAGLLGVSYLLLPVVARVMTGPQADQLKPFLAAIEPPAGYVYAGQQAITTYVPVLIVLAGLTVGNEFSQGTMALTLTLESRRGRVLFAKSLALLVVAVVSCVVVWAAGLVLTVVAAPFLPPGLEAAFHGGWTGATAHAFAGGIPSLVVWTGAAVLLGVVTRNAGAAAGLGVAAYFLESSLAALAGTTIGAFSATGNAAALQHVNGFHVATGLTGTGFASSGIPAWRAGLVLLAWTAALYGLAYATLRRRDVA